MSNLFQSFDLNTENWADNVGKDKTVIIEFYATYCGYCRKMQPQWDILAEHYMGDNTNRKDVLVAKIDGENNPTIPRRFNINSYPTILIFRKGDIYPAEKYYGSRTFDLFRDWVERIAGPEEVNQPEPEPVQQVIDDERMLIVGNKDLADIAHKLEFLVGAMNGEKKDAGNLHFRQKESDVDTMKIILSDISSKISGGSLGNDEVNFGHGICFMIIGLFIGVGVSYTAVNYKKLSKKKLSTKV